MRGRPKAPARPLLAALALATGAAGADPVPARAAMVADVARLEPGGRARVGVRIRIDPGWHVYWRNPGDAGLPTKVAVRAPPGGEVGELAWPLPHRFDEPGGITAYGYPDEVVLVRPVLAPAGAEGRIPFAIEARWLVCRERCLEGSFAGTGYLPVGPRLEVNQELFARAGAPLPEATGPLAVVPEPAGAGERAVRLAWDEPVTGVAAFPVGGAGVDVRVAALEHAGARTRLRLAVETYGVPPGPVPVLVVFVDGRGQSRGVELRVEAPE